VYSFVISTHALDISCWPSTVSSITIPTTTHHQHHFTIPIPIPIIHHSHHFAIPICEIASLHQVYKYAKLHPFTMSKVGKKDTNRRPIGAGHVA